MQLPFPLDVVSLYLLEVQQSCTSSSSVILAHARPLNGCIRSSLVLIVTHWIVIFAGILSSLPSAINRSRL